MNCMPKTSDYPPNQTCLDPQGNSSSVHRNQSGVSLAFPGLPQPLAVPPQCPIHKQGAKYSDPEAVTCQQGQETAKQAKSETWRTCQTEMQIMTPQSTFILLVCPELNCTEVKQIHLTPKQPTELSCTSTWRLTATTGEQGQGEGDTS